MNLLKYEIRKKLPKLYETESIPIKEKNIICKFFNPFGRGTWYVLEGEAQGSDYIFFGLVDLHEQEFGYFLLSELESIKFIERDLYFEGHKIKDVYKGYEEDG